MERNANQAAIFILDNMNSLKSAKNRGPHSRPFCFAKCPNHQGTASLQSKELEQIMGVADLPHLLDQQHPSCDRSDFHDTATYEI